MNVKRFLSFMTRALMAVALLLTLGVAGCDDDDDGPSVYNGTVLELLADARFKESASVSEDVALDSLNKYLSLNPSLTAVLQASPEVTLFAPSNTAFKSLLATPGFPANIADINPEIIAGVLAYHIVTSTNTKSELTENTELTTIYPAATAQDKIIVNADGTLKTGSSNQSIVITSEDNLATNGVVHVVGSVMIPQSVGATLTPILGTMAGTLLLGADFTFLADIIAKADAGFSETATDKKVATLLANPSASATFFATPDAVFSQIGGDAFVGTLTAATARALLLNHYISGKYVVTASAAGTTIVNGASYVPATGSSKTIVAVTGNSALSPYGVGISNTPSVATSFRPIVVKDLVHSNGVIQVFGGLLQ
jgi:uncharacterized surface protein with fasciclin (FAS1) repeats